MASRRPAGPATDHSLHDPPRTHLTQAILLAMFLAMIRTMNIAEFKDQREADHVRNNHFIIGLVTKRGSKNPLKRLCRGVFELPELEKTEEKDESSI